MSKFWIDYATSVMIEAKTAEEAEELFWNDDYKALRYGNIQIDGVEEVEEDD